MKTRKKNIIISISNVQKSVPKPITKGTDLPFHIKYPWEVESRA